MKILLMGNPNVGKSVVFSRLTGIKVISSNYAGTTVSFMQGQVKVGLEIADLIDVPGTLSLDPTCEAEEIAARMLDDGDVVVDVIDSTNLERNLYLTLQLLERSKPMLVVLNMWDETRHKGIHIDVEKLSSLLGVPVITTAATSGQGLKELVESLHLAAVPDAPERSREERWTQIGEIITQVQQIEHRHHRWYERVADASVRPFSGSLIALAVMLASFYFVRLIGESMITFVFDPLFENAWKPLLVVLSGMMGGGGMLHDIVIGRLIDGEIDFVQSFGLLSSGLYVPIAMVLPYIVAFYLLLGMLEDIGYLPRLAVLMDAMMHRLGLHGYAIIPTLLGLGCNVPAVLATRILESKRERFIAATLISIAVPCAALQAMVFGLLGDYGIQYVLIVYATLFVTWLVLGTVLRFSIKGFIPELLIEIPPYRMPTWQAVLQKLWLRASGFIMEALPVVLVAILVVNLLYVLNFFNVIADITAPVLTGMLGLPKEAITPLLIGFLRKDVAVGMLAPLDLSAPQLVVGCTVLAMFFPCIATFIVLFRELGFKDILKASALMLVVALGVGTLLNSILTLVF